MKRKLSFDSEEAARNHARKLKGWDWEVDQVHMPDPYRSHVKHPVNRWLIKCWYPGADHDHDPFYLRVGGYVR